jgi:hypothetical protein
MKGDCRSFGSGAVRQRTLPQVQKLACQNSLLRQASSHRQAFEFRAGTLLNLIRRRPSPILVGHLGYAETQVTGRSRAIAPPIIKISINER